MNEPTITLVGNIADAPELRFTPSGDAVCKFRMAQTPRFRKGDEWVDGEPLWMTVTAWRKLAENVAETLKKGDRVLVLGRLRQRTFEAKDGTKVTVNEVEADEVGAALTFATAVVTRAKGGGGGASREDWGDAQPAANGRPAATQTASAETQRAAQAAAPATAGNPSDDW